jgi:hypothetical protein
MVFKRAKQSLTTSARLLASNERDRKKRDSGDGGVTDPSGSKERDGGGGAK